MIILPAIDIKDGTCVRLYQGSFDTVHQVAEDPLETALAFANAGASWIHMVDLDGALQGKAINTEIFLQVAKKTPLRVELGGGIRTLNQIERYLDKGISRVVLGSVALEEPALVKEAVEKFGEAIAVGIDCRDGFASGGGWRNETQIHFLELAKEMAQVGVKTIIYTDIAQDGTLLGPTVADYQALLATVHDVDIIASGGIRNVEDIRVLRDAGLAGAICGKAIYAGTLDLREAIVVAEEER